MVGMVGLNGWGLSMVTGHFRRWGMLEAHGMKLAETAGLSATVVGGTIWGGGWRRGASWRAPGGAKWYSCWLAARLNLFNWAWAATAMLV